LVIFRLRNISEQHKLNHQNESDAELNFVSIHVRRTDYVHYLESNGFPEVDLNYYKNAMQYLREKYKVKSIPQQKIIPHFSQR
jgi:hypothetical protein